MHVVLDFNTVLRNRFSGFWTYGQGLLAGLVEHPQVRQVSLLAWRGTIGPAQFACKDHPKVRLVPLPFKIRLWEQWWRHVSFPALQRLVGPFDVYHCIHHLMPPTRGVARVLTVCDLRQYRLPELYPHSKSDYVERAIDLADRILTISEASRQDVVELMRVPITRIDVSPLAVTGDFRPASDEQVSQTRQWLAKTSGKAVGPYVLAIGSPDKRKNIATVIHAFAKVRPQLPPDVPLVLAGRMPKNEDLSAVIAQEKVGEHVIFTGGLDQEQFQAVLAAAGVFVFLSLYEGFGLPLVEAMASGVPVISSNVSCMPEVVDRAGILLDPNSVEAVARAIGRVQGDDALRAGLIAAGLKRAAGFSWQRTAEDTVQCYLKAIAGAGSTGSLRTI